MYQNPVVKINMYVIHLVAKILFLSFFLVPFTVVARARNVQQIAVDTVLNVCETCHCLLCFNLLFGCFFYSICDLFCYLCFFCWICYPGNLLQIFVVAYLVRFFFPLGLFLRFAFDL